jgi:hypothetical protein
MRMRHLRDNRAHYTVRASGDFVLVEDLGTGKSVTSDAARVLADLWENGWLAPERPVLYCDSDGRWDEIRHDAGRFTGFAPVGGHSAMDAIARWNERQRASGDHATAAPLRLDAERDVEDDPFISGR